MVLSLDGVLHWNGNSINLVEFDRLLSLFLVLAEGLMGTSYQETSSDPYLCIQKPCKVVILPRCILYQEGFLYKI